MSSASKPAGQKSQKGGFVLGLIVGLLVGLAVALGVALYITKVPIPFVNKVPQRTAEQDAAEAERNRNWDPNAPLAGGDILYVSNSESDIFLEVATQRHYLLISGRWYAAPSLRGPIGT